VAAGLNWLKMSCLVDDMVLIVDSRDIRVLSQELRGGVEYMEGTGTVQTQISKIEREEDTQGLLSANSIEECTVHYYNCLSACC
jgi:hypothetical protein